MIFLFDFIGRYHYHSSFPHGANQGSTLAQLSIFTSGGEYDMFHNAMWPLRYRVVSSWLRLGSFVYVMPDLHHDQRASSNYHKVGIGQDINCYPLIYT